MLAGSLTIDLENSNISRLVVNKMLWKVKSRMSTIFGHPVVYIFGSDWNHSNPISFQNCKLTRVRTLLPTTEETEWYDWKLMQSLCILLHSFETIKVHSKTTKHQMFLGPSLTYIDVTNKILEILRYRKSSKLYIVWLLCLSLKLLHLFWRHQYDTHNKQNLDMTLREKIQLYLQI